MKKIMIIEDDTVLRDEVATLLKNSGYEVQAVTDLSTVLEQMKSSGADLILLDINLPFVGGETLLQEFRKVSDTPVIMLTSRSTEIDEVLSMSFGADDYITKPYNPTILLLRISAVLKRFTKTSGSQMYHDAEVIVTRDDLMTALWDNDEFVNDNALSVNISRLRGKLADLGFEDAIETRKKQGYVLK